METGFGAILQRLAERDLILPYFEAAIISEAWPDKYGIEVDSRPYYGAGDGYFHPSTHPLLGERLLYYMFHPDTRDKLVFERPSVRREMFFAMGSALHAVLQTQMQMCGLVRSDEDIEVEYINDEHHVRGRIDWNTHHPTGALIPVEFKTQNSWDFKRQKEPKPEWVAQLNLGLDAMDKDFGVVLVAERGGSLAMTEFHIHRDRELLDGLYAKFDRVRAAVAASEPPRHCCAPDSAEMKVCPARHVCWLAK